MLLSLIDKIRKPKVVAFLVDGDNVSHSLIREFMNEAGHLGRVSIRRVYSHLASGGNWKSTPYADHGITPVHVPNVTKRKNASDLVLTMDAVELALSKKADTICIVSDDSDYTFLAHRLREIGVSVYGFGTKKSPEVWQNACDGFYMKGNGVVKTINKASIFDNTIEGLEREIVQFLTKRKNEEIAVSLVGTHLIQLDPFFSPKTYGFRKLTPLIQSFKGVTTYMINEHDLGVKLKA